MHGSGRRHREGYIEMALTVKKSTAGNAELSGANVCSLDIDVNVHVAAQTMEEGSLGEADGADDRSAVKATMRAKQRRQLTDLL